ncbi:MAG: hypothetical protein Q9191_008316, partial [Dirinaria sp. TL-2023a]
LLIMSSIKGPLEINEGKKYVPRLFPREIISDATGTPLLPVQRAYLIQKDSMFFSKLPLELRLEIYQYLLLAPEVINPDQRQLALKISKSQTHWLITSDYDELDVALVRTCRASVYETYPILYGQNVFSFARPQEMHRFQFQGLDPEKDFGTDVVAGSAGRHSLLRHVSLNWFINRCAPHKLFGYDPMSDIVACWKEVENYGHEVFPALQHLYIDFNMCYPTEANVRDVSIGKYWVIRSLADDLAKLQDFLTCKELYGRNNLIVGNNLAHLTKLTVVGANRDSPFITTLKYYLKPDLELLLEPGWKEKNTQFHYRCWNLRGG